MKRNRKILCGLLALVLVVAMSFVTSTNVYAASSSNTYKSSGKMSVVLSVGQTGDSSSVTINVRNLPENAIITKLEVNTGSLTYQGGVLTNYLTISSSNGRSEQIPWNGAANKTLTTSRFLASQANGTYTISFNATCLSGPIVGGSQLNIGTKTYSNPYIVIYWDDSL
ncbi:MAG: hypothetical protein HDR01_03570 [Lachnospiraceae bacterium]|nr:hypothetical protein [Lachnospiraceae bacterium]